MVQPLYVSVLHYLVQEIMFNVKKQRLSFEIRLSGWLNVFRTGYSAKYISAENGVVK